MVKNVGLGCVNSPSRPGCWIIQPMACLFYYPCNVRSRSSPRLCRHLEHEAEREGADAAAAAGSTRGRSLPLSLPHALHPIQRVVLVLLQVYRVPQKRLSWVARIEQDSSVVCRLAVCRQAALPAARSREMSKWDTFEGQMSCMPTLYNTAAVAQVKSISVSNPPH